MPFVSRLLSIGPRIFQRDGALVAATPHRICLLNFGLYFREVIADPRTQEITLYRRYAWFFTRRRKAEFSAFNAVTYGYRDASISSWFNAAHDGFDVFSVGLRAQSGEEFHLFDFMGEGTFTNNSIYGDWQYWSNYLLDASGSQESDSKSYAQVLAGMMGIKIAPPGAGY